LILEARRVNMSKVTVELSTSLDGFIAGPNDNPENGLGDGGDRLFKWYNSGDTDYVVPDTDMRFKISRASAELLHEFWPKIGASVTGRRTFDIAHAWGGNPPGGAGAPYFVVTHNVPQEWVKPGSPFTFVIDGVESAVEKAKQAAGDKNVDLMGASIVQQCIKAGLLDEIQIDLAPVLLGGGVHLFDYLGTGPIELERMRVVEGLEVTHLRFRVVK
jgi:dihydrofolate reductase